ncbi:MAG: porin family protein [Bacteroidaceae bacterium]|nr:PorT family protein [Bacteroidaceae bacterium]
MRKTKIFLAGITSLFLLGATLPAFAQVGEQRNDFAIGFNAGINMNTVSFSPTVKQNSLNGMTGGFTARYISEKYFSIICGVQLEVNYSQKGWDEKFTDSSNNTITTRGYRHKMNYIEIPFLSHLGFGKEHGTQFYVLAGPQIGFLINDAEEKTGEWTDVTLSETESAVYGKAIENKFSYGITGGLGMELKTKKLGNFLIEGRYYYELSDFFKTTKSDYFSRAANMTLCAKITYLFNLSK